MLLSDTTQWNYCGDTYYKFKSKYNISKVGNSKYLEKLLINDFFI